LGETNQSGQHQLQMIMDIEDGGWDRFIALQGGMFSMAWALASSKPLLQTGIQWQHIAVFTAAQH
jgi:hypothetical protein